MKHATLYALIVSLLAPVFFAVASIMVIGLGTEYEGTLFPVVSEARITSIEAYEGGSLITVEFEKRRDCKYLGISWYRGTIGGHFERVNLDLRPQGIEPDGSTRPTGLQRGGPWFVDIPLDEVTSNSFARIRHQCHPLYETTSIFYP
jgi:hypothetical protein